MTHVPASVADVGAQLVQALQLGLGGTFVLAAISKSHHPRAFFRIVDQYEVVRWAIGPYVGPWIIAIEYVAGVGFLTGVGLRVSLGLAYLLMALLAAGVVLNLIRGRDVQCGCFGNEAERVSVRSLVRIGMILAALSVLAVARAPQSSLQTVRSSSFMDITATLAMTSFLVVTGMWAMKLPELSIILSRLGPRSAATVATDPAGRFDS